MCLAAASPSVADMVAMREDGKAWSRPSNCRSSVLRLVGNLLHDQTPRSRQLGNGGFVSNGMIHAIPVRGRSCISYRNRMWPRFLAISSLRRLG